jgi:DNA-binding transcriptional ArsR family regulator
MVTHNPGDRAFAALADPTRRAVLDMLRRGRRPAGEIAQVFPVSRPAISKHLRLLLRARLVTAQFQGRHRYYQLNPEPLMAVDAWLEHYRPFWAAKLAHLKAFVESADSKAATSESKAPPERRDARRQRSRHPKN